MCQYPTAGHPSWPWLGAGWAPLPAALLPASLCQLAAGSGAALTSAESRAVSWEKSVHGASLPWQCNLLRASKSRIASPVATGSGPGVAGTGDGDTRRGTLAWQVLPGSQRWGAWPWWPCTRARVCAHMCRCMCVYRERTSVCSTCTHGVCTVSTCVCVCSESTRVHGKEGPICSEWMCVCACVRMCVQRVHVCVCGQCMWCTSVCVPVYTWLRERAPAGVCAPSMSLCARMCMHV